MAIPASQIVNVIPRLIAAGGTDLSINGLFLSHSDRIPLSDLVVKFAGPDDVGAYFGTDSEEYSAAVKYFLGYDNSFTKPRELMIARRVDTDVAANVIGSKISTTLADFKLISDGAFAITIDGEEINVSGVNLASATSLSAVGSVVASAISSDLAGVTVEYSSLTGGFIVTSPTTGDDSTITAMGTGASGTDLSTLMGLSVASGAVVSQGKSAMSVADNFAEIRNVTDNWVTFTTLWAASEAEAVALADWANGRGVDYLYVCHSTDPKLLNASASDSIAESLKDYGATTCIYGGVEAAVFIMAIAASIDWGRVQGAISFAHKQQSGLTPTVEALADAAAIESHDVNFYGRYATRNDEFLRLFPGKIFGEYGFIDTYVNAIWLKNVIQVSVMSGLGAVGRVPYTDAGYALIRAWIADPINRALRNGVIDPGVTLSESQKAQILRETGSDLSSELFTNGYALIIDDAGASVRVNRDSPTVNLYYTYGGSVNRVVISSTAVL